MSLPVTFSKTLATDDADGIAQSQNPASGADLTLNGVLVVAGVAHLGSQRRVIITSAGDDTLITFTIYGTNDSGASIVESIAGANVGAAATSLDFKTVTRIATSGNAGTVEAGTNGVGSTPWFVLNKAIQPINVGIGIDITGTCAGDIEFTYDDPNAGLVGIRSNNAVTPIPVVFDHSVLNNINADSTGSLTAPVNAVRWTTNSGTGTAAVTFLQAGIAGP
jgi:hypothetical protein